jgi:hypothetical protein
MFTAPYDWVLAHIGSLIAWGAFVFAIFFAFYRFIVACYRAARAFTTIEQRVLAGETTLHAMANNHLPHLQKELEDSNKHLIGLREDMQSLSQHIQVLVTRD